MLKWLKDALVQQLVQEVRRNAQRYDQIFSLLQGQNLAIKTLSRKVDERMSELSDAVAAIAEDVSELQTATKRVLDLLQQPNPDVQSAIAALQNADAGFDAIRDSLNAAGGSSTPEPKPAEG